MQAPACCCRFFGFMVSLFLCHQLAVCLFRCMAAIGRTLVVAYTIAWLLFLLFILLGGYVLTKGALWCCQPRLLGCAWR